MLVSYFPTGQNLPLLSSMQRRLYAAMLYKHIPWNFATRALVRTYPHAVLRANFAISRIKHLHFRCILASRIPLHTHGRLVHGICVLVVVYSFPSAIVSFSFTKAGVITRLELDWYGIVRKELN